MLSIAIEIQRIAALIDIHCHILPGLDDGPLDLQESYEMLRIAREDGISHIFATPHIIKGLYDNVKETICSAVREVFSDSSPRVLYGADIRITHDIMKRVNNGEIPTLNGSNYILVELPHFVLPPNIDNIIFNLRKNGLVPIITHPERNFFLRLNQTALYKVREAGARYQLTAMSLCGGFGKEARKFALDMIKAGIADFVATDAHDSRHRPPILSLAFNEVHRQFGDKIARKIFFENVEDIMADIIHTP